MGTNYYAVRKLTDNKVSNLRKILTKPERIHVGKSSGGWEFIFNHNNWEHYKTKNQLINFLKNSQIRDEYGIDITYEDFFKVYGEPPIHAFRR